jgi:uncharacterized membrane protein
VTERTVLETLPAFGAISRAEVARRTGISRPTVSLVLRTLLEDGPAQLRHPESKAA